MKQKEKGSIGFNPNGVGIILKGFIMAELQKTALHLEVPKNSKQSQSVEAILPTPVKEISARVSKLSSELQKSLVMTDNDIQGLTKDLQEAGLIDRFTGQRKAIKKDLENENKLRKQKSEKLSELRKAEEKIKNYERLLNEGKTEEAKKLETDLLQKAKGLDDKINYTKYQEGLRRASEAYGNAAEKAGTGAAVAQTVRNTAVATGAMLATGGTIASVGAVGAFGIGLGTGTGIGALSNVAGETAFVVTEQKTTDQAVKDAIVNTAKDAGSSLVTAAATLCGVGVGGKVGGGIAGTLSTGAGKVVATKLGQFGADLLVRGATGLSAGGVISGLSFAGNTTEQYVQSNLEFDQKIKDKNLTPEKRQQAYDLFMNERGLNLNNIVKNGVIQTSAGAFGGLFGGAGSFLREGSKTLMQRAAIKTGELVATSGGGLGAAYIQDGNLSPETVASQIANTFLGDVGGELAAKHAIKTRQAGEEVSARKLHKEEQGAKQDVDDGKTGAQRKTLEAYAKVEWEGDSVAVIKNESGVVLAKATDVKSFLDGEFQNAFWNRAEPEDTKSALSPAKKSFAVVGKTQIEAEPFHDEVLKLRDSNPDEYHRIVNQVREHRNVALELVQKDGPLDVYLKSEGVDPNTATVWLFGSSARGVSEKNGRPEFIRSEREFVTDRFGRQQFKEASDIDLMVEAKRLDGTVWRRYTGPNKAFTAETMQGAAVPVEVISKDYIDYIVEMDNEYPGTWDIPQGALLLRRPTSFDR